MGFLAWNLPRKTKFNSLAASVLLVSFAFCTVFFAGRLPWTLYATQIFWTVAIALGLISITKQSSEAIALFRPVVFCLCLWMAFVLWVALQAFSFSVYPFQTYNHFIQLGYYTLLYIVCVPLFLNKQIADWFGHVLAGVVLFIGLAGMIQRFAGSEFFLIGQTIENETRTLFGPFGSENDYGGLLALAFPWMLAMLHYRLEVFLRESKGIFHPLLFLLSGGNLFLFFVLIFSVGACYVAMARSALFVIVSSLFAYGLSWFFIHRKNKIIFVLLGIASACALFLFFLADKESLAKFDLYELSHALRIRLEIWMESLDLWKQFPWSGCGVGTYAFISSSVLTLGGAQLRAYHADNHFVELWVEAGVVGALLFMTAVLGVVIRCGFFAIKTESTWKKLMRFQAVIAMISIGALEMFAFHLRAPLIAMVFIFQLAFLTAHYHSTHSFEIEKNRKSAFKLNGRFLAFVMMAALIFFAANVLRNFEAWRLVRFAPPLLGTVSAVKIQPQNAERWYQLAKEQETFFYQTGEALYLEKAIQSIEQATFSAPTYGHYWFYRGVLVNKKGLHDSAVVFLKKAIQQSPHYYHYHYYLLRLSMRMAFDVRNTGESKKWFDEAKSAYKVMTALKVPPPEWSIRDGLGVEYYQALRSFLPYWKD